jgi:hypothetical protein
MKTKECGVCYKGWCMMKTKEWGVCYKGWCMMKTKEWGVCYKGWCMMKTKECGVCYKNSHIFMEKYGEFKWGISCHSWLVKFNFSK